MSEPLSTTAERPWPKLRPYRQIWEKMKEDLDPDIAEFFSRQDEYSHYYFELTHPGAPLEMQLIRLLKKIINQNASK